MSYSAPFVPFSLRIAFFIPVALILYVFGLCIYRLYFHPYAKIPGPILGRLTYLYGLYHSYKGDLHIDVWHCHEKYGTHVRYAPDRLIINTNAAVRDIYGPSKQIQKSKAYGPLPVHVGSFSTHTAIDKALHGRKRRIVGQSFSDAALRSSEAQILTHVDAFCSRLLVKSPAEKPEPSIVEAWSEPRDLGTWSVYYTLDVVSHLSFGKSFSMLRSADLRWIAEATGSYITRSYMAMQYPSIFKQGSGKLLSADTWLLPHLRKKRERYLDATVRIVQQRIDEQHSEKKHVDVMHYLLSAKDPETGKGLEISEIWSEAYLMINAGGDTTATAISATFFYLSRNPDALQKVTQEVRSRFKSRGDIRQGLTLASCVYLRACLDEAMRLSPPAPGVFWREILPGGATISNTHYPAGLDVGTSIYAIHHNATYFPEPFSYIPERWLVPSSSSSPHLPFEVTEETISIARSAFIPFSTGPRACVAKPLAYVEMSLAVATILWAADMKVVGRLGEGGYGRASYERGRKRRGEYQIWDRMTSYCEGPLLSFRARSDIH